MGIDFFILGLRRGGTTLLSALLTQNPEIFVLNDSSLMGEYQFQRKHDPERTWEYGELPGPEHVVDPRELSRFLDQLKSYFAFQGRGPDPGWRAVYVEKGLPDDLVAEAEAGTLTLRRLFDRVYDWLLPEAAEGARVFGEKSPRHGTMGGWIRTIYPDTRFVFLLRHPLAAIASMVKYGNPKTVETAARHYMAHWHLIGPPSREGIPSLLVRHEDVVLKTDETLEKVENFLGVTPAAHGETFDYYVREGYIGNRVDKSRLAPEPGILSDEDERRIRRYCAPAVEKVYPDDPF